jgi:hypothetical protein
VYALRFNNIKLMKSARSLFILLLMAVVFVTPIKSEEPVANKIVVGPNILVSRDGDIPHVELIAASNPKNTKSFLGAAITQSSASGGWSSTTYSSIDGGITWSHVSFPEIRESGALDPQVGFGSQGTAYFSAIRFVKDEKGQTRGGLIFYRSEDNGLSWQKPLDLGYSYDHPIMGVDHTKGSYSGRVYISVLYGYPIYTVGIFRSEDDGHTFIGPVEAANGGGKFGINTISNVVILRDGTLVIPYVDFEFDPEKAKKQNSLNFWMASSSDGGVTFSSPRKIGIQQINNTPEGLRFFTVAVAAADVSNTFPDRIYLVWNDFRAGKYRMVISYSSDRGKTWSKTEPVDPSAPSNSTQFQPAISVNKDGVLGVTWFDTRNSTDDSKYDEYFTASLDGGKTFLPPVRVSTESSIPSGSGNQLLIPSAYIMQEKLLMDFTSAYSRWANGGDYMGLTSDNNGIFHPFWADSRTGTFQIQTAAVKVIKSTPATNTVEGTKVEKDLTNKVELIYDPAKYDSASKAIDIPIHIKNNSGQAIFGPLKLELLSIGGGFEWEDKEEITKNTPEVLNAANGMKGAGAIFDFTSALGTESVLEDGALSGAVVWRMKLVDPNRVPSLRLKITGAVLEKK